MDITNTNFAKKIIYLFASYIVISPYLITLGARHTLVAAALIVILFSIFIESVYKQGISGHIPVILAFSMAIALNHLMLDVSYDGPHYHLPAAIEIRDGLDLLTKESRIRWVNIYPSGAWRLNAAFSIITHTLHNGIFINSIFVTISIALLATAFKSLKIKLTPKPIALLFLTSISPVTLSQASTAMVDGLLCSVLLSLISGCIIFLESKTRENALLIISLIVIAVSTKTSGIYFVSTIGILFLVLSVKFWSNEKAKQLALIGSVGILVALIGNYKPLVTEFIRNGTVIPDQGKILANQVPNDMSNLNHLQQFLSSSFAQTGGNTCCAEPVIWKIPGTFSINELKQLDADPRTGGFGPFFGGLLVFSLFLATRNLMKMDFGERQLMYIGFGITILCFLFPEPWWARYIPIFGVVPYFFSIAVIRNTGRIGNFLIFTFIVANTIIGLANIASSNISLIKHLNTVENKGNNFYAKVNNGYSYQLWIREYEIWKNE